MAIFRKPLFFLLLLSLMFTQLTSHTPPQTLEVHSSEPGELDLLKSKLSLLESTIDERSHELRKKDEKIKELEMAIQEKSDSTSNSHARARATELEKIKELEMAIPEKSADSMSNSHAMSTELVKQHLISVMKDGCSKFINFLGSNLRSFPSKIIDVYDASKNSLMPLLASHWNDHGRPALAITTQKALEKKDQLKIWAEPQIRNIFTHLIPMMKEQCSKFINYLEPHIWSLLDASKNTLAPHLVRGRTLTDLYIQEVKKFFEPYVNHVVMVVTVLVVFGIARCCV